MSETIALGLLIISTLFFKLYLHIKLDIIHERFQEQTNAWKIPRAYFVPYCGDVNRVFFMDKLVCNVCYVLFITTAIVATGYMVMI